MKKVSLKLFALALLATSLSSCLGDTNTTSEQNNAIGYVTKSENYNPYILLGGGYPTAITDESVNNLTQGEMYRLSYKINTNNTTSEGVYVADYISNVTKVDRSYFYPTTPPAQGEGVEEPNNYIPAVGFNNNVVFSDPDGKNYGDNWMFSYTCSLKSKDEVKVSFYYDATNQIDEPATGETEGKPVDKNKGQVIIDVRFERIDGGTQGTETASNKSFETTVSLSQLRSQIIGTPGSEVPSTDYYNLVGMKFRYLKKADSNSTTEKDRIVYEGYWAGQSNPIPKYPIVFSKEKK